MKGQLLLLCVNRGHGLEQKIEVEQNRCLSSSLPQKQQHNNDLIQFFSASVRTIFQFGPKFGSALVSGRFFFFVLAFYWLRNDKNLSWIPCPCRFPFFFHQHFSPFYQPSLLSGNSYFCPSFQTFMSFVQALLKPWDKPGFWHWTAMRLPHMGRAFPEACSMS